MSVAFNVNALYFLQENKAISVTFKASALSGGLTVPAPVTAEAAWGLNGLTAFSLVSNKKFLVIR